MQSTNLSQGVKQWLGHQRPAEEKRSRTNISVITKKGQTTSMHRTQHLLMHPAFTGIQRAQKCSQNDFVSVTRHHEQWKMRSLPDQFYTTSFTSTRHAYRTISSAPMGSVFSRNGCVTLRTTAEITRMK
ncbi:uncharacterized protein [Littorina saxatilis]|uniref:uncharacterized protein isoform X3 n=1 Tax=Littorina saxatilis TaxID=31220 RepID=UPI0038B43FC2